MNKHKNRQSSGATEPLCAHWMARPGAQKWAAKDEWGSNTESHSQQEPGTLAGALQVTDLRSGVAGEGSGGVSPSRWPLPASAPGGWAPLTRRPFAPRMPGGPRDPGGPCGRRKNLEKPPFQKQVQHRRIYLQCRRLGFNPWVGKIPGMHPTPVLLPGESHGQRSPGGLQSTGSQRVGHN